MELKEFISQSLQEIALGMLEADKALANQTNAIVNPADVLVNSESSQAYGRTRASTDARPSRDSRIVERIDFDVSVTVQEGSEAGGGIKVSVMNFGVGANAKTDTRTAAESRIKFSVPMVFPTRSGT